MRGVHLCMQTYMREGITVRTADFSRCSNGFGSRLGQTSGRTLCPQRQFKKGAKGEGESLRASCGLLVYGRGLHRDAA